MKGVSELKDESELIKQIEENPALGLRNLVSILQDPPTQEDGRTPRFKIVLSTLAPLLSYYALASDIEICSLAISNLYELASQRPHFLAHQLLFVDPPLLCRHLMFMFQEREPEVTALLGPDTPLDHLIRYLQIESPHPVVRAYCACILSNYELLRSASPLPKEPPKSPFVDRSAGFDPPSSDTFFMADFPPSKADILEDRLKRHPTKAPSPEKSAVFFPWYNRQYTHPKWEERGMNRFQ